MITAPVAPRSPLATALGRGAGNRSAALIPYLMAGFPDPDTTIEIGEACIAAGAAAIELGIPAREAPADGPVIRAAGEHALASGTGPETVLQISRTLGARVPIVLIAYEHTFTAFGALEFLQAACGAGVAGVLIPDLAPESTQAVQAACRREQLGYVPLLRPDATLDQVTHAAQSAAGFVYLASTTGRTGERKTVAPGLANAIKRVRVHTSAPVAVGFGISAPWQVRAVARAGADAVIVGSRLIRATSEALEAGIAPATAVGAVVDNLVAAIPSRKATRPYASRTLSPSFAEPPDANAAYGRVMAG